MTMYLWLAKLTYPQWVVFLALMPLLWMFQQSQSVLSLLLNTLAIPLLALAILPLSILALLFQESIFSSALNGILALGFETLNLLGSASSWLVYKPTGPWLLALLVLVLSILSFKGFPFRNVSVLLVGVVYCLPMIGAENRFIVFDVGQGLAVSGVRGSLQKKAVQKEVQKDAQKGMQDDQAINSWLYDTGAQFRSGFSLGEAVVAKNLLAMSAPDLDLVFISHSDNDHAGGEAGLRRKIKLHTRYLGQPRTATDNDCHTLGSEWHGPLDYRWRVFNLPKEVKRISDNDQSCVVQFEIKGRRILMPGDIEKGIEKKLVQYFAQNLKSEVLLVPHHGSKTSSSLEFIQQVAPQVAIISSGFNNSFKHPHEVVLARYKSLAIPVYITALSGAIEIDFEEGLSIIEWRKQKPPRWRQM